MPTFRVTEVLLLPRIPAQTELLNAGVTLLQISEALHARLDAEFSIQTFISQCEAMTFQYTGAKASDIALAKCMELLNQMRTAQQSPPDGTFIDKSQAFYVRISQTVHQTITTLRIVGNQGELDWVLMLEAAGIHFESLIDLSVRVEQ